MGNACLRGSAIYSEEEWYTEEELKKIDPRQALRKSQVYPKQSKPAVEILPSSQEGVMRVKLIISSNQMASMMNASCRKDDFLESLITSLLKEKGISIPEQPLKSHTCSRSSSSWRPALESIPEARSP